MNERILATISPPPDGLTRLRGKREQRESLWVSYRPLLSGMACATLIALIVTPLHLPSVQKPAQANLIPKDAHSMAMQEMASSEPGVRLYWVAGFTHSCAEKKAADCADAPVVER